MRFNVSLGKPKVSVDKENGEVSQPIFTKKNLAIAVGAVALVVIIKQQAQISALNKAVDILAQVRY